LHYIVKQKIKRFFKYMHNINMQHIQYKSTIYDSILKNNKPFHYYVMISTIFPQILMSIC
jgi:hypothetical protein